MSLYGCMLRIRVEDLSDEYLGLGEKQKLLQLFEKQGKPPIVLIAHIIVSEDLSHDNAFVQHVNSHIIWEWLKKVPPTASHCLPLPRAASHCLPRPPTASHGPPLPPTLPLIASHCLSLPAHRLLLRV